MKKQLFAAFLAAFLAASLAVPASALLNNSGAVNADAAAQPSQTVSSGAFTGSTPLVRYLYGKFSSNPSSISVPTNLFSSSTTQGQFDELGEAATEAYMQNGLTDYVVNFDYSYSSGSSNITMNITYDNQDTKSRQANGAALNQKAASIVSSVTSADMTARQKAEALNNYVAQNVKYDFAGFKSYQAGQNVYGLQTAYAALVGGKAICQGFASAYKLLCDKAGIPCVVIFGTTKQFNTAHAWCRVSLDGKWETVDPSNPQLNINQVGSFCIPPDVAAATLIPDVSKTLVNSKASQFFS